MIRNLIEKEMQNGIEIFTIVVVEESNAKLHYHSPLVQPLL